MNIAIIFAGGSGVRMGAGIPKQFLEINGKPILVHTLQLFQYHDQIDCIDQIISLNLHLGSRGLYSLCRRSGRRVSSDKGKTCIGRWSNFSGFYLQCT